MSETPHLISHFMAVGAEKRLEDYHFLRNTYETITGQEIQLNRILRMLGEDEFSLNWRTDLLPVGRSRCRSLFEFDRMNNPLVLKGSIAYERLRDLEHETFRYTREPSAPVTSRRVQEIRERRQRFSEQRECPTSSSSTASGYPASSSRLRALAEYDTALADSEKKRQREADEKRYNTSKDEDRNVSERKRDKYKSTFDDEDQKYGRSKQSEDQSNNRLGKNSRSNEDQDNKVFADRNSKASTDQENKSYEDRNRKASTNQDSNISADRYRKASTDQDRKPSIDQDNKVSTDRSRKASSDQDNKSAEDRSRKPSTNEDNNLSADRNRKASTDQDRKPSIDQDNKVTTDRSRKASSDQDNKSAEDQSRKASTNEDNSLSADRNRKASSDQETVNDKIRTSSVKSDNGKTTDIELISFTVRCETLPSTDHTQDDEDISIRLLCKWASPSSSSAIDYYTIERQVGDEEWSTIGEEIDKFANQTKLEISSSADTNNLINENRPTYFRLKAHLQNGQIFMSKPTDGIYLNSSREKRIVEPDVEVLSSSSVQLTWNDNKDKNDTKDHNNEQEIQSNIYDIEKKEEDQNDWEKVTEVPLSQRSARIDSLTDAKQCQFRLIPTASEPEEVTKTETQAEPEQLTVHNVNELLSSLHIVPTSPTKVDIDISEEGFKQYDSYKVEYTTANQLDQWKQMSDIAHDDPHLTIDGLKQGTEYKFRFTPIVSGTTANIRKNEINSSQLSLILDVKTPSARRGRFTQDESETPVTAPSQSSAKEVSAETKTEEKNPATSSSKDSSKKETNETERKSSVASSSTSKRSLQQDVNEDETPTAISSKSSIRDEVDDDRNSDTIQPDSSSEQDVDANTHSPALSPKTSFRQDADEEESESTATSVSAVPQFKMQKLDSTSVLIEAVVPEDEPATFEDVFDIYSKKETTEKDWTKVGTIDKEHTSTTVEDLEEDTAYAFKIDNTTTPSADNETNTIQEFKFVTTPAKQYDPLLFLERIEESLENVVNGVMEAAAGHQIVEEPINKSLNEVIKEVFRDETLVPSEKYGFETLALNNDLQLYRGPKQMMLKELEIDETVDSSKHYGEIIIHNYRTAQQSVVVREENGNTRVANVDGDVIIRNVVSDVTLKNEQTHHQLSMNIVGQAFLKGVQGSLIASKFRGIIVVKNVNKP